MKDWKEIKYWVWLSLIENLGPIKTKKILDIYHTPEKIYNLNKQELIKIEEIEGIGKGTINNILNEEKKKIVDKHINYMKQNNIDIVTINNKEYPELLKEIYDSPIVLYVKGDKSILKNKSIAIVGCREASEYGKKAAQYFAENLAKQNINIVSGLAKGIDSYAHAGTMSVRGKTIAVVGNGLDTTYPIENYMLANKIIDKGGAIISEYPLGTKPEKMNFPARNRIISGISKGVIVVEAKEKSGTLITVDFALEQGRDVFVVPGNINSINSTGTNDLIKQGAKMVTNYKDIEL